MAQLDENLQRSGVQGTAQATQRVFVHEDQRVRAPCAHLDRDTCGTEPAAVGLELQPSKALHAAHDRPPLVREAAAPEDVRQSRPDLRPPAVQRSRLRGPDDPLGIEPGILQDRPDGLGRPLDHLVPNGHDGLLTQ